MYASVIIEYGNKAVDKTFTYIIPNEYRDKIKIGHRVLVPFNNKNIEGFVLEINDKYDGEYDLKEIDSIVDEEPILNDEMLYIGNEIQKEILCSKISIYQAMLPKALKAQHKTNIGIKRNRYMALNKDIIEINNYINSCKSKKQVEILSEIIKNDKVLVNSSNYIINSLLEKGLVKFIYEEINRYSVHSSGKYNLVKLNLEQEKVVNNVEFNKNNKSHTNKDKNINCSHYINYYHCLNHPFINCF